MVNERIDCSLSMYRRLFKWNEALALSRDQNHRDTAKLVEEYFEFLTSTNQQEIAGELRAGRRLHDRPEAVPRRRISSQGRGWSPRSG